jgi:hypothetical protein
MIGVGVSVGESVGVSVAPGVGVYVPAGEVLVMQFVPAALAEVWTVAATIKLTNTISAAIKIA